MQELHISHETKVVTRGTELSGAPPTRRAHSQLRDALMNDIRSPRLDREGSEMHANHENTQGNQPQLFIRPKHTWGWGRATRNHSVSDAVRRGQEEGVGR